MAIPKVSLLSKNWNHMDLPNHLQTYFGLAIRRNTDNVDSMVIDIWALYFHKLSSDTDPYHRLCPKGETSWCGYEKANTKDETYNHKNGIPVAVIEFIKPVFRSLSNK